MAGQKTRVLYWGDSPTAATGFGTVAREIIPRLHETGKYEIFTLGLNYFGDPHEFEGTLRIFPVSADDPQGRARIGPMLTHVQPDVLFTLIDYDHIDWFPNVYLDACQQLGRTVPWVWYTPVDGEPLYPQQMVVFRDLVTRAVTTSKYGQTVLQGSIPILDVPVVYHGVDPEIFYRMDDDIRDELRTQLELDGKFIVLSVGVNQLRKQYGTLLEAFAAFRHGREDQVRLALHTDPFTPFGYDIRLIARRYGFEDEIVFTNPQSHPGGIDRTQMGFVYNLADVAVFPHCGEGFGLCHLEAMACEVPVIAHGATATPEIVKDGAGVLVPTEQIPTPNGEGMMDLKLYFPGNDRGKHRPLVSLSKLIEALETVYADAELRRDMGQAGRAVATSELFSWATVARRFDEILNIAASAGSR